MPLTDEQTSALRQQLLDLEAEIETSLVSSTEGSRPVDLDKPIGRLTRMDEIQQQKMVQATRRRQELRLRQVGAALSAMQRGEYGVCLNCDEPIALSRLQARPESRVCLSCQEALEAG